MIISDLSYCRPNRGLFVVYGSSILVCGYLAFRILWGFVLSVEPLFGIRLAVCEASSPRAGRDDKIRPEL